MDDLFDDDEKRAKNARDAALKRVRENGGDWQDRALLSLALIPGFVGTAEDIRIRLVMKGLVKPHHHNAWGAMIKEAIRQKRITSNGDRRHMKGSLSNARKTDVYVVRS